MTNFLPSVQRFRTITLRYSSLSSTNELARELFEASEIQHGTAIRADFQEHGRGQMGSRWNGNPGENIYMSLVLELQLPVDQQFLLNMAVALAVRDTLEEYLPGTKIKWPNDLYFQRQKIAGILIENSIQGSLMVCSIIGIGINVLQMDFGPLTKAGSVKQHSSQTPSLDEVYAFLIAHLEERIASLDRPEKLREEYHHHLLFFNMVTTFEQNGRLFKARVGEIDEWGRLCLDLGEKTELFSIKDIRWVDL